MQLNANPMPAACVQPQDAPAAEASRGNAMGALHLALAAATASLLAGAAQAEGLQPAPNTWQVDSAVLVYKEGDGRVTALEPIVSARRTDGNDRSIGLRLTLDALTGSSPNGAVAQPGVQTFTSPSGKATYSTPAGKTPLNPEFRDTRVALLGSYERPLGENQRGSISANVSGEHDFASVGASASWSLDLNNKNSTLSLGLSGEFDRINPEGGIPLALKPAFGASAKGNDTRQVVDLLAGWTQVMSRRWLMQFSWNHGRGSGYHSDPYKIVSVVDGSSGLVTGDRYVNENRPNSRSRNSLFVQSKWHLTQDVVDTSYRYYRDDWGIAAHTLDARYRYEMAGGFYLEPHLRLYRQSEADFYRAWLVEGSDYVSGGRAPAYASADQRLAAFSATTLGLKIGKPLAGGKEWSLRVESYRQKLDRPANAPGALAGLDLTPDLSAVSIMVGYSLPF